MQKIVPLLQQINSQLAPWEVYDRIAEQPYSVYLDSGMDHQNLGKFSFISFDPFLILQAKGTNCQILQQSTKQLPTSTSYQKQTVEANPFDLLKELLATYPTAKLPDLPPLTSGVIGYLGYDLGQCLETLPNTAMDDVKVPDTILGFYDTILIYDHQQEIWLIASTGLPEKDPEKQSVRQRQRIEQFSAIFQLPTPECRLATPMARELNLHSNFAPTDYQTAIQKVRDYIAAGDIFQANLSQRFTANLPCHPWELYKILREINPAPFASYLNYPEVIVASASPERYLLVTDRKVETRPIKGTRPRGITPTEDSANRTELLTSSKDRAELVMIIDLERNDLGRVCKIGTVHVPDLIRLEEYPTVFHLVSTVEGLLADGQTVVDLLKASFPGGSITGAPKIRAMEIIEELEQVKRGVYTGSIGYLDFNGDVDLNIVIRTFVIKADQVYYQVGGGITTCSVPAEEHQETLDKGAALRKALELALERHELIKMKS